MWSQNSNIRTLMFGSCFNVVWTRRRRAGAADAPAPPTPCVLFDILKTLSNNTQTRNLTDFVKFRTFDTIWYNSGRFCKQPMEIFVCYHCKPAWKADLHFEFLLITFSIFAEIKSGIKFSEFHKKYRFDKKPNSSNLIRRQAAAQTRHYRRRRRVRTPRSTTTLKVHTFQLIFADPPDSVVLHGTYFYRVWNALRWHAHSEVFNLSQTRR